jgi:ATP-binding cassette subfamily F protein 2
MAPSASKQKRLAEKAAKNAAGSGNTEPSSRTSTPTGSANGRSTPLTSLSGAASKANSQEDLSSMARLNIATERYVFCNLVNIVVDD